MIKAYTVRYDEEIKKTIDTHTRIDKELEIKRSLLQTANFPQEGFVEGLHAVVVDSAPPAPSREEIAEQNAQLLEEAKAEAKRIVEQAKKEAEQIKNEAYAAAQKKGYNDGTAQANRELMKQKAEFEEQAERLSQEYESMMHSLEPQMAEIIAQLVEKITGIMVQDKDEVIYYLVSKAIKNMDKSDEYTVKVSKDDYEYVLSKKNLLLSVIGREVKLYIAEDTNLEKNHCLIETELRVIDCSLDVQLNNLLTDLKLLGGI